MTQTKTKAPFKRGDKEKTEARTNEMLRVMLDGAQKWDFVQFVRERESDPESPWFVPEGCEPLKYSQIRRYVGKAKTLIETSGQGDREQLLARALAQRDAIYAKAISQGDMRAALAILDSRDRLLRLFPREDPRPAPSGDGRLTLTVIEQLVVNQPATAPELVAAVVDPLQLTEEVSHHAEKNNGQPAAVPVHAENRDTAAEDAGAAQGTT